jgi:hypothetical protein
MNKVIREVYTPGVVGLFILTLSATIFQLDGVCAVINNCENIIISLDVELLLLY